MLSTRWLPPLSKEDGESHQEFASKVQEVKLFSFQFFFVFTLCVLFFSVRCCMVAVCLGCFCYLNKKVLQCAVIVVKASFNLINMYKCWTKPSNHHITYTIIRAARLIIKRSQSQFRHPRDLISTVFLFFCFFWRGDGDILFSFELTPF